LFPLLAFILVVLGFTWDVLVVFSLRRVRGLVESYVSLLCLTSFDPVSLRFTSIDLDPATIEQRKRPSLKTLCRAPSGALTIPTFGSSV